MANFGSFVNCYMCKLFAHMHNSRGPYLGIAICCSQDAQSWSSTESAFIPPAILNRWQWTRRVPSGTVSTWDQVDRYLVQGTIAEVPGTGTRQRLCFVRVFNKLFRTPDASSSWLPVVKDQDKVCFLFKFYMFFKSWCLQSTLMADWWLWESCKSSEFCGVKIEATNSIFHQEWCFWSVLEPEIGLITGENELFWKIDLDFEQKLSFWQPPNWSKDHFQGEIARQTRKELPFWEVGKNGWFGGVWKPNVSGVQRDFEAVWRRNGCYSPLMWCGREGIWIGSFCGQPKPQARMHFWLQESGIGQESTFSTLWDSRFDSPGDFKSVNSWFHECEVLKCPERDCQVNPGGNSKAVEPGKFYCELASAWERQCFVYIVTVSTSKIVHPDYLCMWFVVGNSVFQELHVCAWGKFPKGFFTGDFERGGGD